MLGCQVGHKTANPRSALPTHTSWASPDDDLRPARRIRRTMTCHAGRLTDPMGTIASVRAEAAVSPTQAFSANSENRPISAAVTSTGNSSVFRHTLRVPKTHTLSRSPAGATTDEKSLFGLPRKSNLFGDTMGRVGRKKRASPRPSSRGPPRSPFKGSGATVVEP